MCNLLSVVVSIAAAGLMGGGGLGDGLGGIGESLGDLGSTLTDSLGDVVGEIGDVLGDTVTEALELCGDACSSVLSDLPAGLTGEIDLSIFNDFALENLDFASTNLFESIGAQSASFLTNGTAGLTEMVNNARGFIEQAGQAYASIQNAANFTIGGQSFNALTIFDQVSGGAVSKALSPVNTVLGAASGVVNLADTALTTAQNLTTSIQNSIDQVSGQFSNLTSDLSKMGTMYDFSELTVAFEPGKFAQNLVSQGLPGMDTIIEKTGVTVLQTVLSNPTNPAAALEALRQVPASAVQEIVEKTNFGFPIKTLDQALIPTAILATGTLALVNDFKGLADRVASIGPASVGSFKELGEKLSSIEFPRASGLIGLESDATKINNLINSKMPEARKLLGSGTGVFGNPTMDDVMGTFTGKSYAPKLKIVLDTQKKLMSSPSGVKLKAAIKSAVDNAKAGRNNDVADAAAIRNAGRDFVSPGDPAVASDIALLNNIHQELLDKLVREKRNLAAAKIRAQDSTGTLASIMAFVASLETAWQDDLGLGYREWVEAAATNDLYGEAIRAAIIEGRNRALLQSIGISPRTQLASLYATEEEAKRAAIFAKCCPDEVTVVPDTYSPSQPLPKPSFKVDVDKNVIVEGGRVRVTVTATNVDDGSTLPFKVSIDDSDISPIDVE